jgi:hypothetical protein
MSDDVLRKRIHGLVEIGVIPCDEPEELWAGRGLGARCIVCEQAIPATTVEYEVELAGQTLRLHRRCYELWQEECEPLRQA